VCAFSPASGGGGFARVVGRKGGSVEKDESVKGGEVGKGRWERTRGMTARATTAGRLKGDGKSETVGGKAVVWIFAVFELAGAS
jgi:hypothetical protein